MKISHLTRPLGFWKHIKADALLMYRVLFHPKSSRTVKALIIGLVAYIILPFDIIPGRIIGLGLIDDIGIAMLVTGRVKKMIPERLRQEIEGKIIEGEK